MPTYRSISIALHSQFDVETLPEYCHTPSLSPPSTSPPSSTTHNPPPVQDTTSACTVYIPSLAGSRFWLSYAISPPVPAEWYFLFKLYVDGVGVVSWCSGREEGWCGKVMFGLFAGEEGGEAVGVGAKWERRVFCFGAEGKGEGEMEIRVFRASGRKRVKRDVRGVKEGGALEEGGIRLVNAGRAGSEQPKRFYKLALIDPSDQPFATFRYHCRSWEQLRELGLLDGEGWAGSEDGLSVIEPGEDCTGVDGVVDGDSDRVQGNGDGISVHDWDVDAHEDLKANASTHDLKMTASSSPRRTSIASGTYIPRGAPTSQDHGSPPTRRRGPPDTHRLSMPPSIKLVAPEPPSRPLPLPQKSDLSSSTAYRPHPAYPIEEWTVPTPSPLRPAREGIATPPLERRKGLGITGAGLMGVLASSWKRSASSTQAARKSEVQERDRSVSY